ncbi:MAG: FAD-dependent oxidoreductase [Halioglobus sp.]
MQKTHTLIIGGGISGLYAAWRLQQQGTPFLLLEAKSILGGRISSKPTMVDPKLGVDLGPTWFWPHQIRMKHLLEELNLGWFEQYTAGEVLYQIRADQAPSRSAGSGAMRSYRVEGGMQKLITALSDSLKTSTIKTGYAVSQIQKVDGQWRILALQDGNTHTFQAEQLVLAVPPRIISSTLGPERYLSVELCNALGKEQTWMSAQAKFVAVYSQPFWRKQGLAGQAFSQVGPLVEVHDASSMPDTGHALFGFLGLPWALRDQMSAELLKGKCLAQLVQLFGQQAAKPDVTYLTDWAADHWVATEQDRSESPRHAAFFIKQFTQELGALKLHLVASEFAQLEAGYLEGALMTVDQTITQM